LHKFVSINPGAAVIEILGELFDSSPHDSKIWDSSHAASGTESVKTANKLCLEIGYWQWHTGRPLSHDPKNEGIIPATAGTETDKIARKSI
jgi:hypothetical protein